MGIVMKISEIQENQITDELIDEVIYSGLDYKNQHLDVAIILGSSKSHLYRVPYAVTEYKNGRIDKIIVSGGNMLPNGNGMIEAEMMTQTAVKMGVEKRDIIVENKAATTVENMVFSRELMKRENLLQKGIYIGIVTTAFHMRRSIKIAEKIFAEDGVNIVTLPGQDSSTRRDTWYKSEKGREIVVGELKNIIDYAKRGIIADFEI